MDVSSTQHPQASASGRLHQVMAVLQQCSMVLAMLAILLMPGIMSSASAMAAAAGKNDITEDIEVYSGQIRRLRQGIHDQQEMTNESNRTEKNVLGELEDIEARLKTQQRKVEDLEVKVQLQQMLIQLKQDAIDTIQADREKVLAHLKKRANAYYKMGNVGFLNITFSSRSLPDLLKFHDAFQTLVTYDKHVILSYRNKIQELQRALDALALELNLQQEFISTTQAEREKNDRIRAEKEKLLAHIRSEKYLHQQAAEEMEKASEDLSKTLLSLKQKEDRREQTFANSKGRLRVPVQGKIITFFNQEKINKLGILRKSAGIAIEAPDGSKVQAVSEGTVIFSGYLRGYGNTVIIHHGYQFYSVTSRLDSVLLTAGDVVKAGTSIGQVSDTASLIEEGLYFEIRHGKESQDPLKWLDVSKLRNADQLPALN